MRKTIQIAGIGALCLALAPPARAASPANAIRGIDVADQGAGVELAIVGNKPPSFTVFKLQDPPRLVVDLAGADVSAVKAPGAVGKGGVETVTVAQYRDEKTSVGRVIIGLGEGAKYDVTARGESVVVAVRPEKPAAQAEPVPEPKVEAKAEPKVEAKAEPKIEAKAEPKPEPEEVANVEPAPEQKAAPVASAVVAQRVDEAKVKHPATVLNGIHQKGAQVEILANGGIPKFEVIELSNPPRLAVDLYGIAKAPKAPVKMAGAFSQARFGKADGKIRIVLDAAGALPSVDVTRTHSGLLISPPAPKVASAAPVAAPRPEARPEPAEPAKLAKPETVKLKDLKFVDDNGQARIEIASPRPVKYDLARPDAHTVVLSLHGAELPKKLERSLDTTAFGGPVAMVSSFNQPKSGDVKVVATLRGEAHDELAEKQGGLTWAFRGSPKAKHGADEPVVLSDNAMAPDKDSTSPIVADASAAGFSAEAPGYAAAGGPKAPKYTGRRLTLDFHDIEVRNLLRLIADVSKKSFLVADDVGGKVTVTLRNVPWDQALDLILKTKGLDKEELGNIIRVAKAEQLAKEREDRAKAAAAKIAVAPLKVRLISVNYARAEEVATRVKEVLTERGSVATDARTNVLIVKDIEDALGRAEGLVRNLDTQTAQVLIEARIIEASTNFQKEVGIQWGGNNTYSPATGNPTGLMFPNIFRAEGGIANQASGNSGVPDEPHFGVNLPAAVGAGSGGALGLVFGSAGAALNINMRLSAFENTGVFKTISAPKVTTIDNREAVIGQGLSIPFSQTSAAGVNTVFVEAKLELKVTPHITNDGAILMKLKATNNQPNPQLTGSNGQPSISKREAETEVLVKDGDTTVIGGIYTRQSSNNMNALPILGRIPILGYFFRHTNEQDNHTELLVFVTPRIVNRQAAAVAQGN